MITDKKSRHKVKEEPAEPDIRCFCNKPHCVSQSYMCRGRGCYTELLISETPPFSRLEHSVSSGCSEISFKERSCPKGQLCCETDLCNHVDSPRMKETINKELESTYNVHLMFNKYYITINKCTAN